MSDSRYYVYAHYTKDTNDLFYIGKGSGSRAFSKKGRSSYWNRIVAKHGFSTEILIGDLDEGRAFLQEILAIRKFNPRCNFTKGGEGLSGIKQTQETIKKRIKRGSDHYRYGKTIPRELVKKMHDALKKLNLPNNKAVEVYCTVTAKRWKSIVECAAELNIKPSTLAAKLRGQSKNNTSILKVQQKKVQFE